MLGNRVRIIIMYAIINNKWDHNQDLRDLKLLHGEEDFHSI